MHAPGTAATGFRGLERVRRSAPPRAGATRSPCKAPSTTQPPSQTVGLLHAGHRRAYAALERLPQYAILGVLWLAACLPVVTVVPATVALFARVRDTAGVQDDPVVLGFVHSLRTLLRSSLILEGVYATAVMGMIVNVYTYPLLPPAVVLASRTFTLGLMLILVATAPYVFSLLTTFSMPLIRVAGTALLLAVGRPLHTLASIVVIAAAATVVALAPPVLIVVAPLAARMVHRITWNAVAVYASEEHRA